VHLFEWKWTDIAAECENYLGPAGFTGVQVSPPSEHALIATFPWYERYQTVSYSLAKSRSGTAAEFADMVQRCARVGVGIYVDAVINHTTAGTSTNGGGSNGTQYTKYEYPNLYTATDFHQPTCAIMDADYVGSADNVRRCELVGLADLNTGSPTVQAKIAGYLNALVDLGVAGFRIDAGKHMAPADISAILALVHQHAGAGHLPYLFLEVIDRGGEAVHVSDYLAVGAASGQAVSMTDFAYADNFGRFTDSLGGSISDYKGLSATMGSLGLPSAQAVVFTTNHDTERASAVRPLMAATARAAPSQRCPSHQGSTPGRPSRCTDSSSTTTAQDAATTVSNRRELARRRCVMSSRMPPPTGMRVTTQIDRAVEKSRRIRFGSFSQSESAIQAQPTVQPTSMATPPRRGTWPT